MKVQLLRIDKEYASIKDEALREIKKVCSTQRFVLGENVAALEREIAAYCGVPDAVGVASGSDALILALMAAGVGPGDKVVTTPFTFFATAGSISVLGAVPVFVDIDQVTYNMDPACLESLLKKKDKKIKAVIPVHLYGQCAEMAPIKKAARAAGIAVIEDAAQAIGSSYRGKRAGSIGDMGCFSFYPTKNLACFGDGGMVTARTKKLANSLKMLRVHGSNRRYYHDIIGVNSRLDELQAAVLRVKLKRLDDWTSKRVRNAGRYNRLFEKAQLDESVNTPKLAKGCDSVYNQYVIRALRRNSLREFLSKNGVSTEIYYPLPLHMQKCFKGLGHKKGDFPESERAARETLALPIYPQLTEAEQRYVVDCIARFYKKG